MAFKMKGFPLREETEVLPEGAEGTKSQEQIKADKDAMEASKKRLEAAKHRAIIGGDPEKDLYEKAKIKEANIQSQLQG